MHCPVLAAAPAMTSAIPSYAPGLRGGAGHRVGAVVDVEEGVGAGRVGRGQDEPASVVNCPSPEKFSLRVATTIRHQKLPKEKAPKFELFIIRNLFVRS